MKDQWFVVKSKAEPHVQSFTTKFIQVYETSKTAVTPHVIKAHEIVDSYYQVKTYSLQCYVKLCYLVAFDFLSIGT